MKMTYDWSDGKAFLMIFCLIIAVVMVIFAYFVPPAQAKDYGNYSLQPTKLQQAVPNLLKGIAPILIIFSIPLLYFLYKEFKPTKGVH